MLNLPLAPPVAAKLLFLASLRVNGGPGGGWFAEGGHVPGSQSGGGKEAGHPVDSSENVFDKGTPQMFLFNPTANKMVVGDETLDSTHASVLANTGQSASGRAYDAYSVHGYIRKDGVVVSSLANARDRARTNDELHALYTKLQAHGAKKDTPIDIGWGKRPLREQILVTLRAASKSFPVHAVADASVTAFRNAFTSAFSKRGIVDAQSAYAVIEQNGARLREALIPLLLRVVVASGQVHAKMLRAPRTLADFRAALTDRPIGIKFNAENPRATAWARSHGGELIEGIASDARQSVADLVAKTMSGTLDIAELPDRIRSVIGLTSQQGATLLKMRDELDAEGLSEREIDDEVAARAASMFDDRAETIAHHETMMAGNVGQEELWAQAVEEGFLTGEERRVWIAVGDEKMCDICGELDGQLTGFDEPWDSDDGPLDTPQDSHVGCRCTEGLVMPEARAAQSVG